MAVPLFGSVSTLSLQIYPILLWTTLFPFTFFTPWKPGLWVPLPSRRIVQEDIEEVEISLRPKKLTQWAPPLLLHPRNLEQQRHLPPSGGTVRCLTIGSSPPFSIRDTKGIPFPSLHVCAVNTQLPFPYSFARTMDSKSFFFFSSSVLRHTLPFFSPSCGGKAFLPPLPPFL